jgi:apolipoprotein D and lipocalin family protein
MEALSPGRWASKEKTMNTKRRLCLLPLLTIPLLLAGCVGMPDGVKPVGNFDLERYLGTWYEIARLDHRFERGLDNVSANYSLKDDGGVRVINRGYSIEKGKWEEAEGKAYFVGATDQGYLKVSFFGPFYGSYVIFELDQENYQYAFISGPDLSYLWLLSRTPEISDETMQLFEHKAQALGFNLDEMILVSHNSRD